MSRYLEEDHSSTVCLDGNKVKRQRELHGLTQLYISKVVGVTTDTISRWENNRYPTMRRENAINLANALEVPLEAILQQPPEDEADAAPAVKKSRYPAIMVAILVVVVLVALYAMFNRQPPLPPAITAERVLPSFAAPATAIPVQVRLGKRVDDGGFILRENFPKGWKLLQAHPPASSLDNVNGVARWIIKAGDKRTRVAYLVQVDPAAEKDSHGGFTGELIVGDERRQAAVEVRGEADVTIRQVQWADVDGDNRIDDGEMLQASYTVDEMDGVYIDWNYLEKLWDAGSYKWDEAGSTFVPVWVKDKVVVP